MTFSPAAKTSKYKEGGSVSADSCPISEWLVSTKYWKSKKVLEQKSFKNGLTKFQEWTAGIISTLFLIRTLYLFCLQSSARSGSTYLWAYISSAHCRKVNQSEDSQTPWHVNPPPFTLLQWMRVHFVEPYFYWQLQSSRSLLQGSDRAFQFVQRLFLKPCCTYGVTSLAVLNCKNRCSDAIR